MVAQPALAAEVRIDGASIVFSAAPGERNNVVIGDNTVSRDFFVIGDGNQAVDAQAPCRRMAFTETTAVCPAAGIETVEVDLGDGDDALEQYSGGNTAMLLPLTVNAGEGDDTLNGFSTVDTFDGGPGDDFIAGARGADVLAGGEGNDQLNGNGGDDVIAGGPGNDELLGNDGDDSLAPGTGRDFAGANAGNDTINWRNGELDKAATNCHEGRDTVVQDPEDRIVEYKQAGRWIIDETCERVRGQAAPAPEAVVQKGPPTTLTLAIDLVSAFAGTFRVKVFEGDTLIARGRTPHTGARAIAELARRNEPSRRRFVATVEISNRDKGGRRGISTHRIKLRAKF